MGGGLADHGVSRPRGRRESSRSAGPALVECDEGDSVGTRRGHSVVGVKVTVLTGAGISTGSGIPDFRGPDGVWTRHPEQARLLEIGPFLHERSVREAGWRSWAEQPAWQATPTRAHRALAELGATGVLQAVLTQNFDGLHQAAGSAPHDVIELHGTLRTTSCVKCALQCPTEDVVGRLDGEPDPRCPACGGILKPDIVYFGEPLPRDAVDRAVEAAQNCSLFVAIGTTLTVQPVASLPSVALDAGADLTIINAEPTPYDRLATEVIRNPIDDAVPDLVKRLTADR